MIDILFYLLVIQFIIISHEIGHAIVGRLYGINHILLIFGIGKSVLKTAKIELRLFPIGGFCRFDKQSHDQLNRTQKALIASAGPAVNILTGFIFFVLGAPPLYYQLAFIIGIINLIPVPKSDGLQILTQIFNKPNLSTLSLNPWLTQGILVVATVILLSL